MTSGTLRPAAAPARALPLGAPVVAIDVGGASVKVALVDATGSVRGLRRVPTPPPGPGCADAVLDLAAREIERLSTLGEAAGAKAGTAGAPTTAPIAVGLALPGLVDEEAGVGIFSENLGWRDVDFRTRAGARITLPVAIAHDVRAAGDAEMRLGAGQGARTALIVTLGTGIAAAVFVDGRPHAGHGLAGEIGHAVVVPGGEPCVCGNRGCLEATASAGAITRRYARTGAATVSGAKDVLALVRAGDPVACGVWESALDALALGLAQATTLLAPEVIVIGGGLGEAGPALLEPLGTRLTALLRLGHAPRLVRARAGQDAGLLGAALAARRLVDSDRRGTRPGAGPS